MKKMMNQTVNQSRGRRICSTAAVGTLALSLLAGCAASGNGTAEGDAETNISQAEEINESEAVAAVDVADLKEGEYVFTKGLTLEEEGTVNVFAFSEGQNYEKVISRFEEITRDTLKTELNFQWASDIKTEQPLKLAEQGDVDLIFDASWLNSASNISQGMYLDLSKYFNNPDYPGLEKAFPEETVEAMRNPGDGCIYGIPFFKEYNNLRTIFIRGDWREELGCEPVTDEETLGAYLEAVDTHKEELGAVAAMGVGDRGWYYFGEHTQTLAENHIFEVTGSGARITQDAYALLNETNSEVLDVVFLGDEDETLKDWPVTTNFLTEKTVELGETWGKYVNADAVSAASADVKDKFKSGLYGAVENELSSLYEFQKEMQKTDPDAKLEYYFYDENLANRTDTYMNASLANNYLYVPYFNDDPDRAMAVLDWVFQSQANNDLFTYGIEGEDFERVGDTQYKSLEPDNKYVFPSWLFSNNPTYIRYDSEVPEDFLEYFTWAADAANFIKHPFAGYSFDTQPVELEYTAFTTVQQDYYLQFMSGAFGAETAEKIDEYHSKVAEYEEAIKEQVKQQLSEYFQAK